MVMSWAMHTHGKMQREYYNAEVEAVPAPGEDAGRGLLDNSPQIAPVPPLPFAPHTVRRRSPPTTRQIWNG